MKKNCLFCNKKEDWIFENRYFYSVFDIHPVSPGHALAIPKRHIVSLLDLTDNEWNELKKSITETINIIGLTNKRELYLEMKEKEITKKSPLFCKKMLIHLGINKKTKDFNIGVNDGRLAGRTIDHLHIQIIPRYKDDVKNPIGGIRTIIPGLGNYKK
ncbi:HIT family protein [Candidatus Nomurabacteria bacterium]|nr:HIT family protein [Candidatus Nomurabacteria bacterium]